MGQGECWCCMGQGAHGHGGPPGCPSLPPPPFENMAASAPTKPTEQCLLPPTTCKAALGRNTHPTLTVTITVH